MRSGTRADAIAILCPSVERWRAPFEIAFAGLGIPYSIEGSIRLSSTPFGSALLSLLRFAWLGGSRRDLYTFMRSPYSGLRRDHVDFLEGRLRGRAVHAPDRVEQETLRHRGQPLAFLDRLRTGPSTHAAVRVLAESMLRAAHGVDAPPASAAARLDLRAFESVVNTGEELEQWLELDDQLDADEVVYALERARVRMGASYEPGRVAVLDMLRARTRHYEVVFVLGLEEGSLPRRSAAATLLDDDARRTIEERSRDARIVRSDPVSADRYLFTRRAPARNGVSTSCARLPPKTDHLASQGPFWEDVRSLFDADDIARWTRRRSLSQVTWPVETAPTERERIRATAALATAEPSVTTALARANGWSRGSTGHSKRSRGRRG